MTVRRHLRGQLIGWPVIAAAVMVLGVASTALAASATQRVSVSTGGAQANGDSLTAFQGPSISGNSRFVAFESEAGNLVSGDTNHHLDVFVRDRVAGTTRRVSVSTAGRQANGDSWGATISADGRYVAFSSKASNLVVGDTNGQADVFVRDRTLATTRRVNVSSSGAQGNSWSWSASIAASGRYVVFTSNASNLVAGDTNGTTDAFLRVLGSGKTKRVSVSSTGAQGNGASNAGSVTPDGRYVAFDSRATNLVNGDTNGYTDVFVRDRSAKTTERVSVSSTGQQGVEYENGSPADSTGGSISADGRYVVFDSVAASLTESDDLDDWDVFLHDRVTGTTVMVSVSASGEPGDLGDMNGQISADGRTVAFESSSQNLPGAGAVLQERIYVRNLAAGTTQEVGLSATGAEPNSDSGYASLSSDGRHVAFYSTATNLVSGDTNGFRDVFVQDRPAP
jgi:Tol biopolymer transport system component